MALDELSEQLDRSQTRRTVVKTGVKIAYAAPIVAASFKLRSAHAGAPEPVSGENPNPECIGATCSTFIPCSEDGNCVCFTTAAGGGFCAVSVSCSILPPCPNGQVDCAEGSLCLVDTCCGDPVCKPVTFGCASAAASDAGIVDDGPTTGSL